MTQPRKKNKDKEIAKSDEPSNSGFIRLTVERISSLTDDGQSSPRIEVGGVPWSLYVCNERKEGSEKDFFCVYLNSMESASKLWEIRVQAVFAILNVDPSKNNVYDDICVFESDNTLVGTSVTDMTETEFMEEQTGFVLDDKCTVEVRFTITSMKGVWRSPTFEFSTPGDNRSDVELLIEGISVHVSKQYLALYSPFFHTLFYKNYAEKGKKKIELKEIEHEEFIELLHVIYPSAKKITDETAEFLLKLGDRFEISVVMVRAEEFLLSEGSQLAAMEKLRLADQYRLCRLLDHCLSKFTTVQEFKEVKESPIYKCLSDATKIAMFEQVVDLDD